MLHFFQKTSDIINKICFALCGVIVLIMSVTIILGVFSRFFGSAIFWTDELARYCYIWLLFIGTPITIKYANGAKMDFILPHLRGKGITAYKVIMYILVAFCAIIMIISGVKMVELTSTRMSAALGIPMGLVSLPYPLGGFFILIHCINGILQRCFGNGDEEIREEDRE